MLEAWRRGGSGGRDRVTEAAGRSALPDRESGLRRGCLRPSQTVCTTGAAAASMSAASIAARNAGSAARTGRPSPGPKPNEPPPIATRLPSSAPAAHDLGHRHDLADGQDVRRPRDRPGPGVARRDVGQGDGHDGARARADGRVDDDAGAVVGQLEQVLELELLARPDLEVGQQVRRQPGQQTGHRGERRAVVTAVGVAADEQPDGTRGGHDRSSTRRSRKWVAHEMHGS